MHDFIHTNNRILMFLARSAYLLLLFSCLLGLGSGCGDDDDASKGDGAATDDAAIDDRENGESSNSDRTDAGVDPDASEREDADAAGGVKPPVVVEAGAADGSAAPSVSGSGGATASRSGFAGGSMESYAGTTDAPLVETSIVGVPGEGNGVTVEPGTLTAGVWDDNRNFDRFTEYRSSLLQEDLAGVIPTSDTDHQHAYELFSELPGPREKLDIALVIDTTGSMMDEIAYLQAEFLAISQTIEDAYPNSEQRWSLVVYRDTADAYVVRSYDFETSASAFRTKLDQQSAGGGGDFPEAADAALTEMIGLSWRADENAARLAFWVADAPHHNENAKALAQAVLAAQQLRVHIYPVASSGIDELTELTMRSAAQLTGGRYLFLTNDSGVGGEHKEPSIPCYFVTKLDDAILRMVDIEMTGEYREPLEEEIIRQAGDPQDGACIFDSGEEMSVF